MHQDNLWMKHEKDRVRVDLSEDKMMVEYACKCVYCLAPRSPPFTGHN